jgi:dTMP kinase
MVITFEGIEGSGKTTQLSLLASYLEGKGLPVLRTREPGGTELGEALRELLLRPELKIPPLAELLIFMAIRAHHVEEVILPALKEQRIVLCDRFIDATYAYQGYGRGIDLTIIETLNRFVTKGIRPNLTVLLDCDVRTGRARKRGHGADRFERESGRFHSRVRRGYIRLSKTEASRFFVVDARRDVMEVQMEIRRKVEEFLSTYGF